MERKPDKAEPSLCVVCAWRETCVKKYSFDGQHCLEYTRDITIKPPTGETGGPESRLLIPKPPLPPEHQPHAD